MAVVSNSSPLIAFAAIEQLKLFPALFESDALAEKSFFIGSDVYDEILRLAGEYEA